MDFDLAAALEDNIAMRQRWLASGYNNKAKLLPFLKPIQALLLLTGERISVNFYSEVIHLTMKVTDMHEVEPFLEAISLLIGEEFDGTSDETTYAKQRTFSMSKFPLQFIADVSSNDNSASCKAVQVGEQIVPVYELRCDDVEQKPTQPADDIPF